MFWRKILSLSNLSFFESEPSFHKKLFQKEKNKLLIWFYAWQLSSHLWFNGRQKLLVAGINWNPSDISFRLKISLWCSVSSLLVFTGIEVKWNWKWYRFHICHFSQNEISNQHEIFMWIELT